MPKKTAARRPAPEREQSRQDILSAATRLFAERGVENVGFGDIAKAARLSRPLVYFYFPDMQSLSLAAINVANTELHQRFREAAQPALSGLDQIVAIGRAYVRFALEEPALFQGVARHDAKSGAKSQEHPVQQENDREFGGMIDVMVAALTKGVRDGTIRPDLGDPGKVAISLWGLTHGVLQLHATKQTVIGQKLGTDFADLPEFGLGLIRRMLEIRPKK
ncbi:MAG: TetR/AcrR family transcriptional regulator [Nibricoccus sp.]